MVEVEIYLDKTEIQRAQSTPNDQGEIPCSRLWSTFFDGSMSSTSVSQFTNKGSRHTAVVLLLHSLLSTK